MSAMRDKRAVKEPKRFWPDRTGPDGAWQDPDLVFGIGPHQCLGKYLAIEQISALFMELLKQPGLKKAAGKAGKLHLAGPFPRHRQMVFETPAAKQSMFLVIAPVRSGLSKADLDAQIATLGNPAGAAIRAALDETDRLHFASLTTIESERGLDLVFELSMDGDIQPALEALADRAGPLLRPLFAHAGLSPTDDFAAFLHKHLVELHGKPWGANGLNYNGLPEFPVHAVEKQARYARFAGRVIEDYLASEAARGSHHMLAMTHVRRILNQDPVLAREATPAQAALMEEARREGFDAYRLLPRQAVLKLSAFRPVSKMGSFMAFLVSRESLVFWLPIVAVFGACAALYWFIGGGATDASLGWGVARTLFWSLILTGLLLVFAVTAFFLAIRRAEKQDEEDMSEASLDKLRQISAMENAPGHAQNHIMAVGEIKPGLLRAFTHAFALWAIRIVIIFYYRPGFVINMGTIQYARWWRLPGSSKTVFYSNYDGSWESYLEDFITRARWGQTAAWSNWKGFPKTRFLLFSGAQDGDAFKRWVRVRQQIVPFWYSRFPMLTTDQIRTNALIHSGVARVQSATEAEEWLRCFGSMPRMENRIETDEVQALLFTGLKALPHSANLVVRLPEAGPLLGEWLNWIRGAPMRLERSFDPEMADVIAELKQRGIIVPVARPEGAVEEHALAHALTISFGDRPMASDTAMAAITPDCADLAQRDAAAAGRRAVFLALSAAGLAKIKLPNLADAALADHFPSAFRMGMAERGRVLGDEGAAAASGWRWQDKAAEAVLLIYAETPEDLALITQVHRYLLENHGGKLLDQTDCAPARADKPDFEHFGYRDGISQPVIRGTARTVKGVPSRDVVEPGEFILGYANGPGFYPPSAVLPAQSDMRRILPAPVEGSLSRFPDFGRAEAAAGLRDFGRNGAFLVMRELRQDVDGFEAFVARGQGR